MKVAIIGAGAIAEAHVKAYVRNASTDAVVIADPNAEARVRLQDAYGIIKQAHDAYEPVLEDDDVAIVDVCTPHYLHCRQAIAALEAGKDVIVEKPLAMTVEEADEMMAAAKRTRRRLFCALCQRMFPAHQKAAEIIEAGEIGEPFLGIVNVIGDEFGRM
ncbi:MAG: Gfo/Idh/MocA family protein, partial [Armatimonadota bacterium]